MAKKKKKVKKKAKKQPLVETKKKQVANKGYFKKGHKPKGGFKKGQSGNPAGRPKGTKERDLMMAAKAEVEAEKKKSIYKHAFEMAFEDKTVLIALLKKLVPDMAYIESESAQTLTDIVALMMDKDGRN